MRKKLKQAAEQRHDRKEEEAELALERAARGRFASQEKKGRSKVAALPVRKEDGSWVHSEERGLDEEELDEAPAEEEPAPTPPPTKGKENKRAEKDADDEERPSQLKRKAPGQGAAQEPPQTTEQQLESIAALSTALLQSPEQHVGNLRSLLRLIADTDPLVARAATMSTMLVFRDLAPGYRIRPPTDKELEVTVSKEVQQLRKYETNFLNAYQSFLKVLIAAAGTVGQPPPPHPDNGRGLPDRGTAIRTLCGLVEGLHHFNFYNDLLNALVPWAGSKDAVYPPLVLSALRSVLEADTRGEASLTVVQLVADLVRRRHCNLPAETLSLFTALRFDEALLTELKAGKDAASGAEGGEEMSKKERAKKWIEARRNAREQAKLLEKQRRNKGAAAAARAERLAVDSLARDAAELDAAPLDMEAQRAVQSQQLEAVCEVYFRVLKDASGPKPAPGTPLLGSALAGLGRVTNLLDFEVVTALLRALCELVGKPALTPALRARVVNLAAAVLSGQGAALTVDMRELFVHLYHLAGCPPSVGPLQGEPWPEVGPEGTKASALWTVTLEQMLLSRSQKHVQATRLAAFAKRLGCAALHAEPGEAMGAIAVARDIFARNPRVRQLLENDADCSGAFDPDASEPEAAGGLFAVAWELALLARHAHPAVAAAAREAAGLPVAADAVVPPPKLQGAPREITQRYSTLAGLFQPPPPAHAQRRGPKPAAAPPSAFLRSAERHAAAAAGGASNAPPEFAPFFRGMRAHGENARLRRELRTLSRMSARAAELMAKKKAQPKSGSKGPPGAGGGGAKGGKGGGGDTAKRGRDGDGPGPQAAPRGGAAGVSGRGDGGRQEQEPGAQAKKKQKTLPFIRAEETAGGGAAAADGQQGPSKKAKKGGGGGEGAGRGAGPPPAAAGAGGGAGGDKKKAATVGRGGGGGGGESSAKTPKKNDKKEKNTAAGGAS